MLLFFIGEYGHMMVGSALMVTFFFGGWSSPFSTAAEVNQWALALTGSAQSASILTALVHLGWYLLKLAIFLWIFVQVRWTLPRFRYDQLMDLGWKTMLPWALFNTIATAVAVYLVHS
jgi:NADH-quinone oxidoreductase subunit H